MALITWESGKPNITDCRRLFAPLTEQVHFFMVGGDGQEAMINQRFADPFRVGVAIGPTPIKGAKVRFDVVKDTVHGFCALVDTEPPTFPDSCLFDTNDEGIAACTAALGPTDLRPVLVTATLVELPCVNVPAGVAPLYFHANVSVASQVSYVPKPDCPILKDMTNVQEALDGLCAETIRFFYVGGDGQDGLPSQALPHELRVGVSRGRSPVPGATVRFEPIAPGKGTVYPTLPNGDLAETDDKGIASCAWFLDGATENQMVTATLVSVPGENPHVEQAPIYFGARLSADSPPAIHVTDINWVNNRPKTLPDFLDNGLQITLDRSPESPTLLSAIAVTMEVAYGFNPLMPDLVFVLHALRLDKVDVGSGLTKYTWVPALDKDHLGALDAVTLASIVQKDRPGVLTRVVLKGEKIWFKDDRSAAVYLDGQVFFDPYSKHSSRLLLPSGSGARASDFESWFLLTCAERDVQPIAILEPTGSVKQGFRLNPKVTVRNNGTKTATFGPSFTITDSNGTVVYKSEPTNLSLAPGSTQLVTFQPLWVPSPVGNFTANSKTELDGDEVPANNEMSIPFSVVAQQ